MQVKHAGRLAAAKGRVLALGKEKKQVQRLEACNAELSAELVSFKGKHAQLADQHKNVQGNLAALQESNSQHSALQSQHADLSNHLSGLQRKHAHLMQLHDALQREHTAVWETAGVQVVPPGRAGAARCSAAPSGGLALVAGSMYPMAIRSRVPRHVEGFMPCLRHALRLHA